MADGTGRPAITDRDRQIATRIRRQRVAAGMTQKRLANAIGVTYQQVNKYERGINRISASRLIDIANIFGMSPGVFLSGISAETERADSRQDRRMLEMSRVFPRLSQAHQAALLSMARALVPEDAR